MGKIKMIMKVNVIILLLCLVIFLNYAYINADEPVKDCEYNITLTLGNRFNLNNYLTDEYADYDWSSYSSSDISIDENGIVTGLNFCNISLPVYYNMGMNYTLFNIEVCITDGIYRIYNLNSKYMSFGAVEKGEYIYLSDYSAYGITCLEQLWYVKKDEKTNRYTISPYLDTNIFLKYVYTNFPVVNDESGMLINEEWCFDSNGFYNRVCISPNNVSGSLVYASDSDSIYIDYGDEMYCWKFEKVYNCDVGILFTDSIDDSVVSERYVTNNCNKTLDDLKIDAYVYGFEDYSYTLNWSSSNEDVVSIDSSSGEITSFSEGTATISLIATAIDSEGNIIDSISPVINSYVINVVGFDEGIYAIYNVACDKYLGATENILGDQFIDVLDADDSDLTKWIVTLNPNGTYNICLMKSNELMNMLGCSSNVPQSPVYLTSNKYGPYYENYQWLLIPTSTENEYYIYSNKKGIEDCSLQFSYNIDNTVNSVIVNDESYNDIWRLIKYDIPTSFNAKLDVYFDLAYLDKYNNPTHYINNYLSILNNALSQYNLTITANMVGPYISVTDQCMERNELLYTDKCPGISICEIAKENGKECTNYEIILDDFYQKSVSDSILFTAHYTYNDRGKKENRSYTTTSSQYKRAALIVDNNILSENEYIVLHEYSHILLLPDHYHEIINGNCVSGIYCAKCGLASLRRRKECIMYSKQDDYTWCADCERDIMYHLYNHHILNE